MDIGKKIERRQKNRMYVNMNYDLYDGNGNRHVIQIRNGIKAKLYWRFFFRVKQISASRFNSLKNSNEIR